MTGGWVGHHLPPYTIKQMLLVLVSIYHPLFLLCLGQFCTHTHALVVVITLSQPGPQLWGSGAMGPPSAPFIRHARHKGSGELLTMKVAKDDGIPDL